MKIVNLFYIIILLTNLLSAEPNPENKKIGLSLNMGKVLEFNSYLKEYDLNVQIQNGFSITQIEYRKLSQLWNNLNKEEKIKLLFGPINTSWKNTLALFLLYALNQNTDWLSIMNNLKSYGAKGSSLTLSNIKSLVTLNTVHYTLLDLLYKSQNMLINGKLCINSIIKSQTAKRRNQEALSRLDKWEKLINDSQNLSDLNKVKCINNFFNKMITAKADNDQIKNRDYWQSPIETLVRGKGDCEDFAIAKYVSLRILGIQKDQLLISIVRLPKFGELHAVLFYYPDGENDPWVMDNLSYDYMGFIRSHLIRMSFKISQYNINPILGFNENHYVEFRKGLKKQHLDKNPLNEIPMFAIAINNSQSLLSNLSG